MKMDQHTQYCLHYFQWMGSHFLLLLPWHIWHVGSVWCHSSHKSCLHNLSLCLRAVQTFIGKESTCLGQTCEWALMISPWAIRDPARDGYDSSQLKLKQQKLNVCSNFLLLIFIKLVSSFFSWTVKVNIRREKKISFLLLCHFLVF